MCLFLSVYFVPLVQVLFFRNFLSSFLLITGKNSVPLLRCAQPPDWSGPTPPEPLLRAWFRSRCRVHSPNRYQCVLALAIQYCCLRHSGSGGRKQLLAKSPNPPGLIPQKLFIPLKLYECRLWFLCCRLQCTIQYMPYDIRQQ